MPFNYSRSVRLLLLVAILGFSQASFAGFVIKPVSGFVTVASADNSSSEDSTRHRFKSRDQAFKEGNRAERRARQKEHANAEEKDGWAGIVALVFACIFYGPFAILFGAIGMQKGRKNRKMAKGAFIAGIVETSLMVLLYTFIAIAIATSL